MICRYPLSVALVTISLFMVELYFLPASEILCVLPMYMYTDKLYSLRLIRYKGDMGNIYLKIQDGRQINADLSLI